jgi:hypothetical protein
VFTLLTYSKGKKIKVMGTENLFNKEIAENFPSIGKIWTFKYRKPIEPQIEIARKDPHHEIL